MSRYEGYIIEVIRTSVLIVFIVILLYFLKLLPFFSDLCFLKDNFTLYEFIEFVAFCIISFLLSEFALRVETMVETIFDFIPQAGKIHRYLMLIISFVFLYWGGVNAFSKLISSNYIWIYQMFFAGVVLFLISKVFLIIYSNGERFGRNILSKIKGL
ncbi:MAG: hypothetical protein ACP5IO_02290 [Elusimicrobiales bacterium]